MNTYFHFPSMKICYIITISLSNAICCMNISSKTKKGPWMLTKQHDSYIKKFIACFRPLIFVYSKYIAVLTYVLVFVFLTCLCFHFHSYQCYCIRTFIYVYKCVNKYIKTCANVYLLMVNTYTCIYNVGKMYIFCKDG